MSRQGTSNTHFCAGDGVVNHESCRSPDCRLGSASGIRVTFYSWRSAFRCIENAFVIAETPLRGSEEASGHLKPATNLYWAISSLQTPYIPTCLCNQRFTKITKFVSFLAGSTRLCCWCCSYLPTRKNHAKSFTQRVKQDDVQFSQNLEQFKTNILSVKFAFGLKFFQLVFISVFLCVRLLKCCEKCCETAEFLGLNVLNVRNSIVDLLNYLSTISNSRLNFLHNDCVCSSFLLLLFRFMG